METEDGEPRGSALRFSAGARVAHYEIIRELGRGGMGQVFLARDLKLGRKVAMKFLVAATPRQSQRFITEARTTAQCSHENIVVIHDVSEHQGTPYMVLEYLDGRPLSERDEGPMSWGRAVEILLPVVRSLVRAHEFGIVHRDLEPENVFITTSGVVKVLDFGIAKLLAGPVDQVAEARAAPAGPMQLTQEGSIVGTLPYMSPEQWGLDQIDHRTDLWSVGIMLFELVVGRHPLAPVSMPALARAAASLDEPMPRAADAAPDLPPALAEVIDRCLEKHKNRRVPSAQALLDLLTPLVPGRSGRALGSDECPYPGLTAFGEGDADRFFGRSREIAAVLARLRDRPMLGVIGPSGAGKSSFVRAGVVPALKASGEVWDALVLRPGRRPLDALTSALEQLGRASRAGAMTPAAEALRGQLEREPGAFGLARRQHARRRSARILVFVDQFEELYTQVASADERRAFTACLGGVADDAATPLRVVISMRSDFLDRAGEDPRFLDELTRGLVFLGQPDRQGLRDALVQPAELAGYRFEDGWIVEQMLADLDATPGALPLLQFGASRLWQTRDRQRRVLTQASFEAMGGVAGALATHAEEVLAAVPHRSRGLLRTLLLRLVTPERTRETVEIGELLTLTADGVELRQLIDQLVSARLLVVQTRGEGEASAVEIVHDSLIQRWPTLRRWLEQSRDDAGFVDQLRTAARQWEERGRPPGLLWRGEAADEARRYARRASDSLPPRERGYLDAVVGLAARSTRRRRMALLGAFAFLIALVVAAASALVTIRRAEQQAQRQAQLAGEEAERARTAERKTSEQMALVGAEQKARDSAEKEAGKAQAQVARNKVDLRKANEQLQSALDKAREARDRAERLADAERRGRAETARLLDREKARVRELERQRQKINTSELR